MIRISEYQIIKKEIDKYLESINGKPTWKKCRYWIKDKDTWEWYKCGEEFLSEGKHNVYCPKCIKRIRQAEYNQPFTRYPSRICAEGKSVFVENQAKEMNYL